MQQKPTPDTSIYRRLRSPVLAFGVGCLSVALRAGSAAAEEDLGPLFVIPSDPNYTWALITFIALITIGACLVTLIRGRAPMVLGTAGLFLLPAFSYVLGDFMVLEESKNVEFCGSCHVTMSPVVDAMREEGDTLASLHYQRGAVSHKQACYQCHSGYGIWGTAHAKKAGIMHMINTVTRDFSFPLKHRGEFDISSCLNCHAGAKPFRDSLMHRDPEIQEALISGEIGCAGTCHPGAHPAESLNGAEAG